MKKTILSKPGALLAGLLSCGALQPDIVQAADLPPFKLGLSTQVVATAFELSLIENPSNKLKFRPAQSNYAGVSLGYRWIGGTLSFAVPSKAEIRDVEGTSQYRDYRLSFYYRNWGAEASYNSFKGYLIDNSSELSSATLNGQTYYKLPDLLTRGYGINFIYVTNPERYSLPAAAEQSEIQENSAGSWLWMATFRHQSIENSGAIIPSEKQTEFGTESSLRSIRMGSYAVGPGYGFNWVPGPFFVAPLLAATAGFDAMTYDLENSTLEHGKLGLNLHLRIGMGVNARNFFLVGNLYADIFGIQTDTLQVSNNIQGVTFSIGARF